MSAQRRNRTDLLDVWNDLVGMWSAEVPSAQDEANRPARDSYTYERPVLSATLDLHAADLIEFSSLDGDDGVLIHLRPTVRP
jgi:hypothetical protein